MPKKRIEKQKNDLEPKRKREMGKDKNLRSELGTKNIKRDKDSGTRKQEDLIKPGKWLDPVKQM